MNEQDKFLNDLAKLCMKYSSKRAWEWKVGSKGKDGIHFKFLYVDVEDTEEKDSE